MSPTRPQYNPSDTPPIPPERPSGTYQRIELVIAGLEKKIDRRFDTVEARITEVDDKVTTAINGPPAKTDEGIDGRLRRVESRMEVAAWLAGAFCTAAIGGFAITAWSWIKSGALAGH